MRLCVIGNPENRRVVEFQAIAVQLGHPRPKCIDWLDVLDNPETLAGLDSEFDIIRLESLGENDAVQTRLIERGGGQNVRLEFGQLAYLGEAYMGLSSLMTSLEELVGKQHVVFQNPPRDVSVMFDKWQCHQRFTGADLPRPTTCLAPTDVAEFREFRNAFARTPSQRHCGRLFLKPRYGSSAAGVCAYRWSGSQEQLIAPIEIDRSSGTVRLFNSLQVRHYTNLKDINTILGELLPQGMLGERWISKARLPDGRFDLRIVVIAGEARHCVVRQSHHPMTNLHLGNRRGDLAEVRELVGDDTIHACHRIAESAAACFPNSLYAGVDVIIDSKANPFVCEINAFGDLLPNLLHRGESTYEAILNASIPFANVRPNYASQGLE